MALELESTIMNEIGLGMSYSWFNGSGSCQYVRREAARRLSRAIQQHHEAGDKIIPPHYSLTSIMDDAAEWDENDYKLTIAWQVASDVIQAHIAAAYQPDDQRLGFLQAISKKIREIYQPKRNFLRDEHSMYSYMKNRTFYGYGKFVDDEYDDEYDDEERGMVNHATDAYTWRHGW